MAHDKAGLGSTVVVLDVKRNDEITYHLVTSEEADAPNGRAEGVPPNVRAEEGLAPRRRAYTRARRTGSRVALRAFTKSCTAKAY